MADKTHRDPVTGRWAARRPVEDIDAESVFNPMADAIEDIDNVSGTASPNTILYPHHQPAQGSQGSPLRARNPVLVHPDDDGHHNAVLRTAARDSGPDDPTSFLAGLESHGTPATGVVVEDG